MSDTNTTPNVGPGTTEEELIAVRREKVAKIRALGINPYGGRFDVTTSPAKLKSEFSEGMQVRLLGRISALRDMGKTQFFSLADVQGSIQCMLTQKGVSEEAWSLWKLLERGDWIGVEGETFITRTGEPSVRVASFKVLSKALRPMPDKYHGVADADLRYRRRHLDLMSNSESAERFVKRSLIVQEIRRYLADRGFLEVETPMLQDIAGGAAARPFESYYNALRKPVTLRIAPELFLKRLMVGGFPKVFELNRNFRNEGVDRRHNPEFTVLEVYEAGGDYESMADMMEEMITTVAQKVFGTLKFDQRDEEGNLRWTVDLTRPWRRADYSELVKEVAGADWFDLTPEQRRTRAKETLCLQINDELDDLGVTQQVYEKLVEEKQVNPLFVCHVARDLVPLAKANPENPEVVDVFELVMNGQELCPGYSEQNDPVEQLERLQHQAGEETQKIDFDFVETLESGMPSAGGIGIGIDRLCMLLTGACSIRDIILFPQLKNRS
ncbi:MAG: lysine--tRNA ligase [Akkermansiaceae bacterium]|nr:lysine--tRNA ligase [Akkermansiaceae bacterium]